MWAACVQVAGNVPEGAEGAKGAGAAGAAGAAVAAAAVGTSEVQSKSAGAVSAA